MVKFLLYLTEVQLKILRKLGYENKVTMSSIVREYLNEGMSKEQDPQKKEIIKSLKNEYE